MRQAGAAPRRRRQKRRRGCGIWLILLVLLAIGLGTGGRKLFDHLKTQVLESQYPIKYQELVEKYAEMYQLDPAVVYGVIRTESKFDPYAVSSAQARGLMQIQPETARDCAAEMRLKDFSLDQLFVPEVNIQMGCFYLSKLLKRYDGDLRTAAAAYNGGPGNVERWLADESLLDEKGRLAHVPFPETRNYVDSVVKACEMYRKLYTDSTI